MSGVSTFKYDVFVSYAAGCATDRTRDGVIARKLARALESYRFPRSLRRAHAGRIPAHLSRVFLDRDETRASADLRRELQNALRDSRTLIVICSPRARRSRWVHEELEIFIKLRGRERVLPLLIEGEPKADP